MATSKAAGLTGWPVSGWVKLPRDAWTWEANRLRVLAYIMAHTDLSRLRTVHRFTGGNHRARKTFALHAGQALLSQRTIAEDTGLSRQETR